MRIFKAIVIWCFLATSAFAQAPGTTTVPGTLLTYPFTFTGKAITLAPTTGTAGFNLPQGTAPTSPVNGDMWSTSAGLFIRIGGVTQGPFGSSSLVINSTGVTGAAAGNVLYSDGTLLQAYTAVPLSVLGATSAAATITGNSMLGNWANATGAVAVQTMPPCTDTAGQHLNYLTNVGITCGTSGGPGTTKGVLQANGSGAISAAYASVISYGADNTGATDSSTAFGLAIAGNNYVFIPCGTYKLNITISVNHGTLTGSQCATLTANSTSTAVITYTGSGDYYMENLYLTGSSNTGSGIKITAGNALISRAVISGFNYGVECVGSIGTQLSGVAVYQSFLINSVTAGMVATYCNDMHIVDNNFGGNPGQGTSSSPFGIELINSSAEQISGNFTWGNSIGIVVGGTVGSTDVKVSNNRITQSYFQGAVCSNASTYSVWNGNTFYDNSNVGNNTSAHLELASGCTNSVVSSNNFHTGIVGSSITTVSVLIDSGSNDNIVQSNNMTGNNSSAVGVSDSGSRNQCGQSVLCSAGNGTNYVH